MIWLNESIFNSSQVKIFKFIICLSWIYVSACQNSRWFINSNLRNSSFKNSTIWLAKSTLDPVQLKTSKQPFTFLQFISACKKSHWLLSLLSRYLIKIWLVESIFEDVKLNWNLQAIFLYLMSLYLHAKNQVEF